MVDSAVRKLIKSLHPLERKILPYLDKYNSLSSLMNITKLKEVEIMRALQWLENKKVIQLKEEAKDLADLGVNGKKYVKEGLPEKRLLEALTRGQLTIAQTRSKADLSKEELNIALGVLRKKAAIFITKEKELVIKLLDQGRNLLQKGFLEEKFLQRQFPVEVASLSPEEKYAFESFKKRPDIIVIQTQKTKSFVLTSLGL